jgi:hypothetical protein
LWPLAFYFFLLEDALRGWPALGEVTVYHGANLDGDMIDFCREQVGRRRMFADWVVWPGFTSTSLKRRVAERFGNVLFVIRSKNRACIREVSALGGETRCYSRPTATSSSKALR